MDPNLKNVIGSRGESFVKLCLTDFKEFPEPLFEPGFLGEKWPGVDFYVELTTVPNKRPYFFIQVKTTTSPLTENAENLTISSTKHHTERLLNLPGPTYIFGVHEPTGRVFVRSVHDGIVVKAITRIPISYELTNSSDNLQKLQREIVEYWNSTTHKPTSSIFT